MAEFPLCPGRSGPVVDRFLQYVAPTSMTECWEWAGAKTVKGYGVFAASHKKQIRAHRLSYELYTGRRPDGMVLHLCDNPACVNPAHLADGTHKENMRQMAERKRAARAERHHKAKLTEIEVVAINLLYGSGHHSTRDLAAMFGMSQPTIASIVTGDLWPDAFMRARTMLAEREKAK